MKQYLVTYERVGESYSAYVPDLPGCIACGDTLEETEQLMTTAIELYIEALKEEGQAVPEPVTTARSITIAA